MNAKAKKELVKKLSATKEHLEVLEGMLRRERVRVEDEIRLATDARRNVDDILYGLTGSEFYRTA